MRRILYSLFVFPLLLTLLLVLMPCAVRALDGDPPPTPVMKSVDPGAVAAGSTVTVEGEYLGKKHVAEVYLTAGGNDLKTAIVSQDDKKLKLKIPSAAKPGKYFLMVLTNRTNPNFIEQPVSVKVE